MDSMTLGYTSSHWLARTDEGDLLVKFPIRDPEPERMRAMIYATRLANEAGVPVTRFRAFVPASRATGTPVVVQEFVAGDRASDLWPSLSAAQRCRLAGLDPAIPPSLVHGDLWWENVVINRGSVCRLLDFEHARFADRFLDFGKLDELVFDGWAKGRAAFL